MSLTAPERERWYDIALVLAATALIAAIASINYGSVFTESGVLPVGNDAFYHSSRILDTAFGERGFYQFDEKMHVPEGSWVSWPWAYDFLMAQVVRGVAIVSPGTDPMAVLAVVPLLWSLVNVILLLAIARALELPLLFRALAVAGFALLPTTQSQHGLGQIDHHYVELTFALLTTWLLMRWVDEPDERRWALLLGVAAGAAQAFHHGLFILQLPVLVTVGLFWLRGRPLPPTAVRWLAASLLVSLLLVAMPSGPVWDLQFRMTTLSWFHVYVATCVAVVLWLSTVLERGRRGLLVVAVVSVACLVPMLAQVRRGVDFLGGRLGMLDRILEMQSPFAMIVGDFGLAATMATYSLLLLLVPVGIAFAAWRVVVATRPIDVAYSVAALIGLGLLTMQYRLNYFGVAFLLTMPWVMLRFVVERTRLQPKLAAGLSVIVFLLAVRPIVIDSVFKAYDVGGNALYQMVQPLMQPLAEACADEPGIVLAHPQFGHYVSFHSDCSVIANNFLIEDLHFAKVQESNALFTVPGDVLANGGGGIRYVLAVSADTFEMVDGNVRLKSLADLRERNPRLVQDLLFADDLPGSVERLQLVQFDTPDGPVPVAGLYRLGARVD